MVAGGFHDIGGWVINRTDRVFWVAIASDLGGFVVVLMVVEGGSSENLEAR